VLVVLGLAFLLALLVAAFGSSSPASFQQPASLPGLETGRPMPQIVALQGTLRIQLPIAQRAVTALGYHGTGDAALPLEPVGRQANEGFFSRVWHGLFGGASDGLRYFRLGGGEGSSTGALDVGARPGTAVYSPVDGTVVSIGEYVLDGRRYGHRLEIQPSGEPSVVVSATHLRADLALTVGSPVAAGSSKIGTVMDFTTVEQQALAAHTRDGGNHVTLAVLPSATLAR
jgi:hypothetical protein